MCPLPTIVEVIGRSSQGTTRPFICRADDNLIYYVKGRYAGTRSLVCEWLAGTLARSFGLPIVPFTQLQVPDSLIDLKFAAGEPLADLGAGIVFGSRRAELSELTTTTAKDIDDELQADIAVFDWWVRNEDRTLSDKGGNPNLFREMSSNKLWVLDHNLAFDPTFDKISFLETHAFAGQMREALSDFVARQSYAKRLSDALSVWPQAVGALPQIWHYVDAEQTVPVGFDFSANLASLQDCQHDHFWET